MNENKTILLVEDNPNEAELTRRALQKAHVTNELAIATDGQEALDYLFGTGAYADREVSQLPALTLLDLNLPKLSGLEVLRRIRSDKSTRRISVVILSSSREESDVTAAYDSGANSYTHKPHDFQQFVKTIESLGTYWLTINEPPPAVGKGEV